MISAFMVCPLVLGTGRLAPSLRRGWHLSPRPFGEECKEAGDVLDDLPGVLAAQITSETRTPDLAGPVDQIILGSGWLHRTAVMTLAFLSVLGAPFAANAIRLVKGPSFLAKTVSSKTVKAHPRRRRRSTAASTGRSEFRASHLPSRSLIRRSSEVADLGGF
jgi:hypothetical protein